MFQSFQKMKRKIQRNKMVTLESRKNDGFGACLYLSFYAMKCIVKHNSEPSMPHKILGLSTNISKIQS